MIQSCRLSYTSYTDMMNMEIADIIRFMEGLINVLHREAEAREAARRRR